MNGEKIFDGIATFFLIEVVVFANIIMIVLILRGLGVI